MVIYGWVIFKLQHTYEQRLKLFNLEKAVGAVARWSSVLKFKVFLVVFNESVLTRTVNLKTTKKTLNFSAIGHRSRLQLLFLGLRRESSKSPTAILTLILNSVM